MKKILLFCILFCSLFSQDKLPNYSVKLLNNNSTTLNNLTDEVTLISFWATWCLPCIKEIDKIYVNRGPGSFAGIRNSISIIKAICLVMKVDYYCYSSQYFKNVKEIKYENIPYLCDKFNVKKNLINPIYIS